MPGTKRRPKLPEPPLTAARAFTMPPPYSGSGPDGPASLAVATVPSVLRVTEEVAPVPPVVLSVALIRLPGAV